MSRKSLASEKAALAPDLPVRAFVPDREAFLKSICICCNREEKQKWKINSNASLIGKADATEDRAHNLLTAAYHKNRK